MIHYLYLDCRLIKDKDRRVVNGTRRWNGNENVGSWKLLQDRRKLVSFRLDVQILLTTLPLVDISSLVVYDFSMSLISHGFSWFLLVSLVVYDFSMSLISPGFSVYPLVPWFLLVSPGFSWFILVSSDFSWFLLVSPSTYCFSWFLLNSPGFFWFLLVPPVLLDSIIFSTSCFCSLYKYLSRSLI